MKKYRWISKSFDWIKEASQEYIDTSKKHSNAHGGEHWEQNEQNEMEIHQIFKRDGEPLLDMVHG